MYATLVSQLSISSLGLSSREFITTSKNFVYYWFLFLFNPSSLEYQLQEERAPPVLFLIAFADLKNF